MLEAVGFSDPGCVRSNNEDYYLLAPQLGLYLVADGMGGAQAGECASQLASETVGEVVWNASGQVDPAVLLRAFEEANRRVLNAASTDANLEGMGTTMTAVLEAGEEIYIASVGDSRAYLFDESKLLPVTEDQTWVHEVGRRLGIDEAHLKTHPMRHVLTMAIGVSEQLRIHSYVLPVRLGMQILLCSDGLHGLVDDQRISEVLAGTNSLEEKAKTLIETARQNGGPDNITAVLLRATDNQSPPTNNTETIKPSG